MERDVGKQWNQNKSGIDKDYVNNRKTIKPKYKVTRNKNRTSRIRSKNRIIRKARKINNPSNR